jgi:uroporphyrinogen III methyltransferase/synthase
MIPPTDTMIEIDSRKIDMSENNEIQTPDPKTQNPGLVSLIGAGPGDPGLLTVRGCERLKTANVVVYDRLAHPSLLDYARSDAELVYVGKASAHHAMKQEDINALLIDRAKQGKSVARLKGGDPFVFGRGGEEAEECRAAGVPFEIVPGVTSAIAAPAYAGIPVTHRDMASSFAVITGHERDDSRESGTRLPGEAEQRRNWANIARAGDTLIFLMGVEALPDIAARLQENGRDPQTPVALVQWGTWTRQQVVTGTLATIVDEVKRAGLTPPAVCVVGEVVRLREKLRWFDDPSTRPLFGKKIVVTRAREQASALSDLLRARGAEPLEFPAIEIVRLDDTSALDEALSHLDRYQWIVLTSANTVLRLAESLHNLELDSRAFHATRIAVIGPATRDCLFTYLSLFPDYMPSEAVAEAILAEWPDKDVTGQRILLPRALEAREILPEQLRERGAIVDVVPAYETRMDGAASDRLRTQLQNREIDVLTFTASSTVRNFAQALVEENLPMLVGKTTVAAIGPVTAQTLREFGLNVDIEAEEHTIPGLVAAIEQYFGKEQDHD